MSPNLIEAFSTLRAKAVRRRSLLTHVGYAIVIAALLGWHWQASLANDNERLLAFQRLQDRTQIFHQNLSLREENDELRKRIAFDAHIAALGDVEETAVHFAAYTPNFPASARANIVKLEEQQPYPGAIGDQPVTFIPTKVTFQGAPSTIAAIVGSLRYHHGSAPLRVKSIQYTTPDNPNERQVEIGFDLIARPDPALPTPAPAPPVYPPAVR